MRFQSLQRLCLRINSQKSIVVAEAQHILLWVQKTFQCTYHLLVESWGKVVGVWFGSSLAEQMCICLLQARQLSIIFRFSVISSTSRDRRSGTCMAKGTLKSQISLLPARGDRVWLLQGTMFGHRVHGSCIYCLPWMSLLRRLDKKLNLCGKGLWWVYCLLS